MRANVGWRIFRTEEKPLLGEARAMFCHGACIDRLTLTHTFVSITRALLSCNASYGRVLMTAASQQSRIQATPAGSMWRGKQGKQPARSRQELQWTGGCAPSSTQRGTRGFRLYMAAVCQQAA